MVDRVLPVRTCVGCRRRSSIDDLLRVVAVDGQVVPDPLRRCAGRGASLHPRPACLAQAERRRAFGRALRVPGTLSTQLLGGYVADLLGEHHPYQEVHAPASHQARTDIRVQAPVESRSFSDEHPVKHHP